MIHDGTPIDGASLWFHYPEVVDKEIGHMKAMHDLNEACKKVPSSQNMKHLMVGPFVRSMVRLPTFLCGNLHVEFVEISHDFFDLLAGERSMLNWNDGSDGFGKLN